MLSAARLLTLPRTADTHPPARFGKWHTGFRSWQHLGLNRGFDNTLGSFQTGGPYSGSHHSMRWQNDHPIWRDSEFNDP